MESPNEIQAVWITNTGSIKNDYEALPLSNPDCERNLQETDIKTLTGIRSSVQVGSVFHFDIKDLRFFVCFNLLINSTRKLTEGTSQEAHSKKIFCGKRHLKDN